LWTLIVVGAAVIIVLLARLVASMRRLRESPPA